MLERQASNSLTVDALLEDIHVNCVNGQGVFQTGLLGAGVSCDFNDPEDIYRRIDGLCNNINHKQRGATGIAMRRLASPHYADGKCHIFNI